ncbi:MAG: asparaginase [Candidatus Microthrix sp.]|jgi:L-asparaginase|nr:asparaginase domain-containing protein [Candidatus Microthrix sp.]MBK7019680.1 asparaginase [Candidatus Microthrix sp.]MBL0206083.1 asparaginase [Candidatus Microthrix sp.]
MVELRDVCNLDSSNISPIVWENLAGTIRDNYDDFDALIVLHGTNTLGYTGAALSFALVNPTKPVVITGSQVPSGLPATDAAMNIEHAVRVAVWPGGDISRMAGVVGVFGSHIIPGTRLKKTTSFDYDAFRSFSSESIGRIGRLVNIDEDKLSKHKSYLHTGLNPPARRQADLRVEPEFDARIASITEFPAMSSAIFYSLVENCDVRGFVLRSFGAGDPSDSHREAFEFLKERKIPIVVTTQAPNGTSNFQVNDTGAWLRTHNLAIPAYDMSVESQTTKLGWLLAKVDQGSLTYDGLCRDMVTDLRGEVNVLLETGL